MFCSSKKLITLLFFVFTYTIHFGQIFSSISEGCAPLIGVEFSHNFGNVDNILWDFDDGTSATIDAPVHTFQDPGVYNVVFTAGGGINETIVITVLESPTAQFEVMGVNSGCIPLEVNFTDNSSGHFVTMMT